MLTTIHPEYASRARSLRNYEQDREPGGNYRLSAAQCAVGIEQIKRLDAVNEQRRRIGRRMSGAFPGNRGIRSPLRTGRRGPMPIICTPAALIPNGTDRSAMPSGSASGTIMESKLLSNTPRGTFFPSFKKTWEISKPVRLWSGSPSSSLACLYSRLYPDEKVDYLIWAVREAVAETGRSHP